MIQGLFLVISGQRQVIMTMPERASDPAKRSATMGQDDHSNQELDRIIEEKKAELKVLLERASEVEETEEKSKC